MPAGFATLGGYPFISLTAYRPNGAPARAALRFAPRGDRAYAWAFRLGDCLRGNPEVFVAPGTRLGRELGPAVPARARLLSGDESAAAHRLLSARYGLPVRLAAWLWRALGRRPALVELIPAA
jgi:PPOX class probable F420-dependent enzyme